MTSRSRVLVLSLICASVKWHVRVLDRKRARRNQSSSSDGPEDAPPIPWDCRVVDGTVTTHDVVVTGS